MTATRLPHRLVPIRACSSDLSQGGLGTSAASSFRGLGMPPTGVEPIQPVCLGPVRSDSPGRKVLRRRPYLYSSQSSSALYGWISVERRSAAGRARSSSVSPQWLPHSLWSRFWFYRGRSQRMFLYPPRCARSLREPIPFIQNDPCFLCKTPCANQLLAVRCERMSQGTSQSLFAAPCRSRSFCVISALSSLWNTESRSTGQFRAASDPPDT